MANRWGNNGNSDRLYFFCVQKSLQMVTAAMKLENAPWKTNLDGILKSRDITLPAKVCLVKGVVFPVVMYEYESWTIKKAECWRIDAFELWCWRGLLRVPWTARRFSQPVLKEISPEYSLERLMLKLKFQYFGHLMWRTDLFERTLMLGKIEGGRRRGTTENEMVGWHHWLNGPESEQAPGVGGGQGSLACCSHEVTRVVHDRVNELRWTDIVLYMIVLQL